tara:strand:- start:4267 stop:4941 length:675 start_codon:yes stop_codon:yes gene_type:complete
MKLSEQTLNVLKNFSTINQNLMIKEGKVISTMSAMKNIVAKANIEDAFPSQVAIYDLNEFLSSISLFSNPNLEFDEQFVTINDSETKGSSLKYFYSDPSIVTTPTKTISMPSEEVVFTLTNDNLNKLKRAASVISAPDLVLERNETGTFFTVKDKKNDTANNYSLDIKTEGNGKFNFYFKVENLKLLDGDYKVTISSKNISHFVSNDRKIEYWIALEPESTYEG